MDTPSENPLETSLRLAADEPAHRPEFFKTLLNSPVYILGTTGTADGLVNLEAGSNVSIAHWQKADGTSVIPFFRRWQRCNNQSTARKVIWSCLPGPCSR